MQIIHDRRALHQIPEPDLRLPKTMAYLRSGEKFDLIFLDPPYGAELLNQALETIAAFDICRPHGITLHTHSRSERSSPAA